MVNKSLKIFLRVFIVLLVMVLLLMAGMRFVLGPVLNASRTDIAAYLSRELNTPVSIGSINSQWQGYKPLIVLNEIYVGSDKQTLHVNQAQVNLSGRGILGAMGIGNRPAIVANLMLDGIKVPVKRDVQDQIKIFDFLISSTKQSPSPDLQNIRIDWQSPFLKWLRSVETVRLNHAQIVWDDELKAAPPLVLDNINLYLLNQTSQNVLSVSGQLPTSVGGGFSLKAATNPETVNEQAILAGTISAELASFQLVALKPWIDIPSFIKQAQIKKAHVSISVEDASIKTIETDNEIEHLLLSDKLKVHSYEVSADHLSLKLNTQFDSVVDELNRQDIDTTSALGSSSAPKEQAYSPWQFSFNAAKFYVKDGQVFDHPLFFDKTAISGYYSRDKADQAYVMIKHGHLKNQDLDLTTQGQWHYDPNLDNGRLDIKGQLKYLLMPRLYVYLPSVMDADAKEWLKSAFQKGSLQQAQFSLNGAVDYFPFGLAKDKGDFNLSGQYNNIGLDYHPGLAQGRKWPVLETAMGYINFHNDQIDLSSNQAFFAVGANKKLNLENLTAKVSNLETDTQVNLGAQVNGPAEGFLAIFKSSPLGLLINNVLDNSQMRGNLKVPIQLSIPINDAEQTRVKGEIYLDNNSARIEPSYPWLSRMNGTLSFDESGIVAQRLTGKALGGDIRIDGPIGSTKKPLLISGFISSDGIVNYVPIKGLKRLSGIANYQAKLNFKPNGGVELIANSSLKGMAIDLPDSFAKTAAQAKPLQVQWQVLDSTRRRLQLDLDKGQTRAELDHNINYSSSDAYFYRVALAHQALMPTNTRDIVINADTDKVNADQWLALINDFATPLKPQKSDDINYFPDIDHIHLKTGQLVFANRVFHQTALNLSPHQAVWDIEIKSPIAAGLVHYSAGSNNRPDQLSGHLDYLNLNADFPKKLNVADTQDDSDTKLPDVNLHIKTLKINDYPVNNLTFKANNAADQKRWFIPAININTPDGHIQANAEIGLSPQNDYLKTTLTADMSNVGHIVDGLGFNNTLAKGSGSLKANVYWPGFIKSADLNRLNTFVHLDLFNGRIVNVDSKAVKVLELLALQAIPRINRLSFSLQNAFQEGLAYDHLLTQFSSEKGLLQIHDAKLIGPAVNAVLEGNANLLTKQLNIKAVAIPQLDASGASVLAGVLLNPVVGVSAFITQWLLKAPLQSALLKHYSISGDWSNPQVKEVNNKNK